MENKKNSIKAIIFDLGGVLIDLNFDACVNEFKKSLGFERITEILDKYHQRGIYGDMEEGKISADEFRAAILRESRKGSTPEMIDRCIDVFLTGMDDYKVDLLKELSGKYDLYILSNNNPIAMNRSHKLWEEKGLDYKNIFKEEFISCEMHMLKPGQEIYLEAIRRTGRKPEEILFVDDSLSNVEAAKKAGMNADLYIPGHDLRALIEAWL